MGSHEDRAPSRSPGRQPCRQTPAAGSATPSGARAAVATPPAVHSVAHGLSSGFRTSALDQCANIGGTREYDLGTIALHTLADQDGFALARPVRGRISLEAQVVLPVLELSLIHISEPTRQAEISYAV